jgi:hypothetical protein
MSEQRVSDEQLAMVLAASKERDAMAERSMFYNLAYDLSDARTELTELERSFSLVNGLYHQLLKDATKDRADLARLSAELEGMRQAGRRQGLEEAAQVLEADAKERERTANALAQLGKGAWSDLERVNIIEYCAEKVRALTDIPEDS